MNGVSLRLISAAVLSSIVPDGAIEVIFSSPHIDRKEVTHMFEHEQEKTELLENIEDLFLRKQYAALRDLLLPLEAADIAFLFDDLDERVPVLFRLLPKELAAEVFVELESDQQELLMRGFSNSELREVLEELGWRIPRDRFKKIKVYGAPGRIAAFRDGSVWRMVIVVFGLELREERPIRISSESKEARFFTKEEVRQLEIAVTHTDIVRECFLEA